MNWILKLSEPEKYPIVIQSRIESFIQLNINHI